MKPEYQTQPVAAHELDEERQALALPAPATERLPSIVPHTIDELIRFSKMIARSNLVPRDYRGKPEDVMVAIMHGLELGLKPLQALRGIAVINGRPTVWGDVALALVRSSALCEYVVEELRGEGDNLEAVCRVKRRGHPEIVRTFSVQDAKRAGLWGRQGPWREYPQRMLQMRARSWALRDAFPDLLSGLYLAEEAMDIPVDEPEDRRPANGQPVASLQVDPAVSFRQQLFERLRRIGISEEDMPRVVRLFRPYPEGEKIDERQAYQVLQLLAELERLAEGESLRMQVFLQETVEIQPEGALGDTRSLREMWTAWTTAYDEDEEVTS